MSDASSPKSSLSPERLSAWTKFLLLAALPAYLIADHVLGMVNDDTRRERREAVCFTFEDEAEEALRQRQLPVSVLGKVDHFLRCGAIKEFSLLGGKISNDRIIAKKKNNTENTADALAALASVESQLQDLQTGTRPSVTRPVEVAELTTSLNAVRETLVQNVQRQEAQILTFEKVTKSAPDVGNWLIVAGANKSLKTALDQVGIIGRLFSKRFPDRIGISKQIRIYERSGNFRTALIFDSRDEAEKTLEAILPMLKYGGYLRDEDEWCPVIEGKRRVGQTQLVVCAAP